jgi:co-chaperonin GroES (HSP10)
MQKQDHIYIMGRVYFYIKKGILLTFKKKKKTRNGIMLYQKRKKKKTRRKLYHIGFQITKTVTLQPRRVCIN